MVATTHDPDGLGKNPTRGFQEVAPGVFAEIVAAPDDGLPVRLVGAGGGDVALAEANGVAVAAGARWTGPAHATTDPADADALVVDVYRVVGSTDNGGTLIVEQSNDGAAYFVTHSVGVGGGAARQIDAGVVGRFVRAAFVNEDALGGGATITVLGRLKR